MGVLGGWTFSYDRGTPADSARGGGGGSGTLAEAGLLDLVQSLGFRV